MGDNESSVQMFFKFVCENFMNNFIGAAHRKFC